MTNLSKVPLLAFLSEGQEIHPPFSMKWHNSNGCKLHLMANSPVQKLEMSTWQAQLVLHCRELAATIMGHQCDKQELGIQAGLHPLAYSPTGS